MKTTILFTRKTWKLEQATLVEFKHTPSLETPSAIMEAVTRGVTRWVEGAKDGEDAWVATCETLNIGDLIRQLNSTRLLAFLKSEGIDEINPLFYLTEENERGFDEILAVPTLGYELSEQETNQTETNPDEDAQDHWIDAHLEKQQDIANTSPGKSISIDDAEKILQERIATREAARAAKKLAEQEKSDSNQ
jgi:hypothetical protein